MNLDKRIALVKEVGEEILVEDELRNLFESVKRPLAYDGFEPSGRMHIAQGLMRAVNVNKMLDAGCDFLFWVADWHGWANNKFGGDLDKIQTAGKYLIEIWKACGMKTDQVKFTWCSDFVEDENYWKTVMHVARNVTLPRVIRCSQIMGRKETDTLTAAQIFYPTMQAADIFHLKIDICQLGMDQRKVNILARELALKLGYKKPVAVHHHMLMGLLQPAQTDGDAVDRAIALKMSKSNPNSAIFMDDSHEEVERKVRASWCPEKQVVENPIIEYCKYVLFGNYKSLLLERPKKFGGDVEIKSFDELCSMYTRGEIFPLDLKNMVAKYVNELLEPVRKHFSKGKSNELMELVKSFTVTR